MSISVQPIKELTLGKKNEEKDSSVTIKYIFIFIGLMRLVFRV